MYGYIYKTTNLLNGKIYIGQHKSAVFEPHNYIGSGSVLQQAVLKYGIDNFKQELLEWCEDKAKLDRQEIYWIAKYNATDPNIGYNLNVGGSGGCAFRTEDTKEKIGAWNKDKITVNNGIISKKILRQDLDKYLADGWLKGVLPFTRDELDKQHHSDAQKGMVAMSKDNIKTWVKQDFVNDFIKDGYIIGWGKKVHEPRIVGTEKPFKWMEKDGINKKVSYIYWDEYLAAGWAFHGYSRVVKNRKGHKPTAETRQKLSESHKGHHNSAESVKKQADKVRGRVVMHKGNIIRHIPKDQVEKYTADGYSFGSKDK